MNHEERAKLLQRARAWARRRFSALRAGELRYCHSSFAAARALEDCEKKFPDLGGCGVEGDTAMNGAGHITIEYINMGDTYEPTICYYKGRFVVASWGDIVERHERNGQE